MQHLLDGSPPASGGSEACGKRHDRPTATSMKTKLPKDDQDNGQHGELGVALTGFGIRRRHVVRDACGRTLAEFPQREQAEAWAADERLRRLVQPP